MKFRVFCDFDGTIAEDDIGNKVFTTFGDEANWWRLVDDWKAGKIDGRSLWREQSKLLRVTRQQLEIFATQQRIDKYFSVFVEFCHQNDIEITVLSDGMDAYIRPILKHHGLGDLQLRSNRMILDSRGPVKIQFPFYEFGCGVCANCKGYHVRQLTAEDSRSVYVGDGISDRCALAVADITFAKGDLLEYCHRKHLDCIPFQSFADVHRTVEKLVYNHSHQPIKL